MTGNAKVDGIIELATSLRGLGAISITYDGLTVTFAAPQVRFAPPTPTKAPLPSTHHDETPDRRMQQEEEENLMLTDPLAFEEMVTKALQERLVQ